MKQTDPLAELRDIHLPDAITWWPLAPAWWLLIILSLGAVIYSCTMLLKRYRGRLYRRQALLRLQQIQGCEQQQLIALFEILKQVSASAYPQHNFASLAPRDFVYFLQNSCKNSVFNDFPDNWEALLYSNRQSVQAPLLEQLLNDAKLWIKQHPNAARLEYQPAC